MQEKRRPQIGIFVFSGTGNTRLAADLLRSALGAGGARVDLLAIEDFTRNGKSLDLIRYDMIGIGHPVHAFNAPRIVYRFLELLPAGAGLPTFTFKSAGDPLCGGGSSAMLRGRLAKRGYPVFHESLYVMPANVFLNFSAAIVKDLVTIAGRAAGRDAREILAGTPRLQKNGILNRVVSRLFSAAESRGVRLVGHGIRVGTGCNGCSLCMRTCPIGNIMMERGRPRFAWRCEMCMRCINGCPQDALIPRPGFFKLKQRIDIPALLADPAVPDGAFQAVRRGYFRHYRRWFKRQGLL
jgi:ferredoxin/flavodoxin